MENLKGTRTQANLMAAFAGESQARVKYGLYSDKAKKDGLEEVANKFKTISDNENSHAEIWLNYLNGGVLPHSKENLSSAAGGEHFEWSEMYAKFAKEASDEGFTRIAQQFTMIAEVEKQHENEFNTLRKPLEDDTQFNKPTEQTWICQNCGHIHKGKDAPEKCPLCNHNKAYFKIQGN